MNLKEATSITKQALRSPVATWPGYSPASIPIAIFNKSDVVYLNHPDPPQERPEYLLAATSTDINGIKTATIPIEMCPDEETLIPLLYHECFHVFQDSGQFQFNEQFNFFKVLSFYPELNGAYRSLCLAEAEILNNSTLGVEDKAKYLAALAKQRYKILSEYENLLIFEKSSERKEGTASFVEQQAFTQLFNKPLRKISPQYGWSRQYSVGAQVCFLLDVLLEEWQNLVELNQAPTDILIQEFTQENQDVSTLSLPEKTAKENKIANRICKDIQASVDELMDSGILRIQLPNNEQILRSFNPSSILSLGDGRLIHTEFLDLQMPLGKISVQGSLIIEDYNKNELILPVVPFQTIDGRVEANTEMIQFSLDGTISASGNIIQVYSTK
ncbi:MAG: hypothetical protein GY943_06715 [Chloroflexi bacterium]|nr:hypothetical protein [Chloroflexota bacterium]